MSYTVSKLITEAYYESSVVSREFETIQGYQLNNGLIWLNQILSDKIVDNGDIPYITTQYHFNGVIGQEKYFIANCMDIQSLTFFIDSVRYQMQPLGRHQYFGTPRANNINALPLSYHYERTFGGINLFVYFFPNQAYTFELTGNFYLNNVTLNQDLTARGTSVNLGNVAIVGAGAISANELVINGVDMVGTYATVLALKNAIDAAVPYVTASFIAGATSILGSSFTLSSTQNIMISLSTLGTNSSTNYVNLENFNITDGPLSYNYTPGGIEQFYVDYLEYQLTERICGKYNVDVPPLIQTQLDRYLLQISKLAEPMDLLIQKISTLQNDTGINYGQVNLGHGWTVF